MRTSQLYCDLFPIFNFALITVCTQFHYLFFFLSSSWSTSLGIIIKYMTDFFYYSFY